ncbi:uncharacterized protein LOC116177831 isoform X2 [Photinus pyralis]|uniref:uncharacterized protein LOC116177831 isoform X2 n=1 Tax=Photinus pyralis TaxID=7054 RepID=UPI0012672B95|nr:uncharacterized protein LOC116177831 isoform X2 [Photinus pyralis]
MLVLIILSLLASRFPSGEGYEDNGFIISSCYTTTNNYINLRDNSGNTPLHLAVRRGAFQLVESLLRIGADVNCTDYQGNTPLHLAVGRVSADKKIIVQMLLAHEASVEVPNKYGETPLIIAIKNSNTDVVEGLINGANVNCKDASGSMPLHYVVEQGNEDLTRLCIKFGANVNMPNRDGNTPLHLSVLKKRINMARILIEHGAIVNEINSSGYTPLLGAFHIRQLGRLYSDPEMIQLLLQNGADPNVGDFDYPIHVAVKRSMEGTVKLLLKYGADVKVQNREGKLPIHIAIGNLKIAQPPYSRDTLRRIFY